MAQSTYQRIFNNFMNVDVFKASQANSNAIQDKKASEIEMSKTARGHFFSLGYLQKYKEAVEKDEEVRAQSFEALDSIDYYNKKYNKKESKSKVTKIPGSFFKVRSQGGASSKDIEEVNKFYKRSFVTMLLLMGQSYVVINFLYDARFIQSKRYPRLYSGLPWVVYPAALIGSIVFMY